MKARDTLVRVKVCGITNIDDGVRAVGLGASALGFVFWQKSPRCVSVERAASIIEAVGPMTTSVGVFVDADASEIRETVAAAKVDVVQLHGDEPPDLMRNLNRKVIRTVALGASGPVSPVKAIPLEVTVLFDVHDPLRRGGSGQQVDWAEAAKWARQRSIILSGGLRPDNVGLAITTVRPYGVDVSSGVEAEPGRKDAQKLEAFFAAVAMQCPRGGER